MQAVKWAMKYSSGLLLLLLLCARPKEVTPFFRRPKLDKFFCCCCCLKKWVKLQSFKVGTLAWKNNHFKLRAENQTTADSQRSSSCSKTNRSNLPICPIVSSKGRKTGGIFNLKVVRCSSRDFDNVKKLIDVWSSKGVKNERFSAHWSSSTWDEIVTSDQWKNQAFSNTAMLFFCISRLEIAQFDKNQLTHGPRNSIKVTNHATEHDFLLD